MNPDNVSTRIYVYVRQPRDRRLRKIVALLAGSFSYTASSAPLSNIFLRDNCRQRFRAARSDPADTGGLYSGTCIARAGSAAGRAERNNERGRKGDGNEARGKDAPAARMSVGYTRR